MSEQTLELTSCVNTYESEAFALRALCELSNRLFRPFRNPRSSILHSLLIPALVDESPLSHQPWEYFPSDGSNVRDKLHGVLANLFLIFMRGKKSEMSGWVQTTTNQGPVESVRTDDRDLWEVATQKHDEAKRLLEGPWQSGEIVRTAWVLLGDAIAAYQKKIRLMRSGSPGMQRVVARLNEAHSLRDRYTLLSALREAYGESGLFADAEKTRIAIHWQVFVMDQPVTDLNIPIGSDESVRVEKEEPVKEWKRPRRGEGTLGNGLLGMLAATQKDATFGVTASDFADLRGLSETPSRKELVGLEQCGFLISREEPAGHLYKRPTRVYRLAPAWSALLYTDPDLLYYLAWLRALNMSQIKSDAGKEAVLKALIEARMEYEVRQKDAARIARIQTAMDLIEAHYKSISEEWVPQDFRMRPLVAELHGLIGLAEGDKFILEWANEIAMSKVGREGLGRYMQKLLLLSEDVLKTKRASRVLLVSGVQKLLTTVLGAINYSSPAMNEFAKRARADFMDMQTQWKKYQADAAAQSILNPRRPNPGGKSGPGAAHEDMHWHDLFGRAMLSSISCAVDPSSNMATLITRELYNCLRGKLLAIELPKKSVQLAKKLLRDGNLFDTLRTSLLLWMDNSSELREAYGYLIGWAVLFQLRRTSCDIHPNEQRRVLTQVLDWSEKMGGRCKLIKRPDHTIVLSEKFTLIDGEEITLDIELMDHPDMFPAGKAPVPAVNFPLGPHSAAVLLQIEPYRNRAKDPSRFISVVAHEHIETILRALGYSVLESHEKANRFVTQGITFDTHTQWRRAGDAFSEGGIAASHVRDGRFVHRIAA